MEGNWPHPTEMESKEETFSLEQIPPLPTTDPPPFPAHHPIEYANNPLSSYEPPVSYETTSPKADDDTPMDCTLESTFRKQEEKEGEEEMMDVGGGRTPTRMEVGEGRTPTRSPPPSHQDMDTPTDYRTSCKIEEAENLVKPVIRPLLNTMLYKPAILKPANHQPANHLPVNHQPAQTQQSLPARPGYSGSVQTLPGLNFSNPKPGSSTHLARSYSVHNRPTYHLTGGSMASVSHPAGNMAGVSHPAGNMAGVSHPAGNMAGVSHPAGNMAGVSHPAGNMAGVSHPAGNMDAIPSCLLPKSGMSSHSNISQTHSLPPLHHKDYESEHHSPKKSAKSSTFSNSIPPPTFPNPLRNPSQGNVGTATPSPLPLRNAPSMVPSPSPLRNAPSPDSAFHSEWYSPSLSPMQSRRISEYSSSCQSSSHRTTPSLSRNNSDASLYGGSQFSYNSAPSPLDSPATSRHYPSPALPSSPLPRFLSGPPSYSAEGEEDGVGGALSLNAHAGISRQQLINSPCPICGDKISGFHYGIFSCESCKGFFKRTVQNKKNYICMRGASCQVTIATRKKCPACRYEKCLKMGMKLEAIREDRTRGGRSTYQCTYTLPQVSENETCSSPPTPSIPNLLQEIMNVEHLWCGGSLPSRTPHHPTRTVGLYRSPSLSIIPRGPLGGGGLEGGPSHNLGDPDFNTGRVPAMPDQLLYQLVKWCKSLPLLKNISIDDQSALLINAWCELLVLSACYRSINTPGYIWVSNDTRLSYAEAKERRLDRWVERMLSFTDQLRRLKVDDYEYVSMKVIVLLTADTSDIRNKDQVRESQEKVVHALQGYTLSHYPELPAKFGEILLRMPELNRVSQVIFSSGAEKGILEFLKFL